MDNNTLVVHGGALEIDANGHFKGLGIVFSTPEQPDTSKFRDYFDRTTDFRFRGRDEIKTDVYFHHGLDRDVGPAIVGEATLKMTSEGLWVEGQLDLSQRYMKALARLGYTKAVNYGLSSGTAKHTTLRELVGGAHHITRWDAGVEMSITPTPAEPMTAGYNIKSAADLVGDDYVPLKSACLKAGIDPETGEPIGAPAGDGSAKAADHEGLMVALYPPADVAAAVAVAGGEPAEALHVTLCYVKPNEPLDEVSWARLVLAVNMIASDVAAMGGTLGGVGRFAASDASDGRDVYYASVDVAELSALREYVRRELRHIGLRLATEHGFSPHMTLQYLEPGAASPADRIEPVPVRFERISIRYGERAVDLALRGGDSNDWMKFTKGVFADALARDEATEDFWRFTNTLHQEARKLIERAQNGEAVDAEEEISNLLEEFSAAFSAAVREALPDAAAKSLGPGLLGGLQLRAHEARLHADLKSVPERFRVFVEDALKIGAALSGSRRTRLTSLADALDACLADVRAMLKETERKDAGTTKSEADPSGGGGAGGSGGGGGSAPAAELKASHDLYVQHLAQQARLSGATVEKGLPTP